MPPIVVDLPAVALAAPPPSLAPDAAAPPAVRGFRLLNRVLMVPLTRAGLGAWVSTPLGGAILLLRVRGRSSGLVRDTPLNYVVADGSAWVLAGFGPGTQWYRNLVAEADAEIMLPGRAPVRVRAIDVRSPDARRRIIPALLRSTAGPTLSAGMNPWRSSPDEVLAGMAWVPLLRLDTVDGSLEPGPDDPGGRGWIWRQAVLGAVLVAAVVGLRRLVRLSLRTDSGRRA